MPPVLINILMVALGGAVGSVLRYCVSLCYGGTHSVLGLPTITVNIVGSFIIGLLFAYTSVFYISPLVRIFLFVGILGGFTTFSSYSLETVQIARNFGLYQAALSVLINNVGGICAAFAGIYLGNKLIKLL